MPYISRRGFLQRSIPAILGATVLSNTIRELRILNTAMAQGPTLTDYKALICVFLNGGNDSNNMIIPTISAEWDNYAAIRTAALAIPNSDGGPATALALNSRNGQSGFPANDSHTYGFHPAMPELRNLFNQGYVAPVFNVGTLSSVSGARQTALQAFLNTDKTSPDLQTKAYAQVLDHSIAEATILSTALSGQGNPTWFSRFPTNITTPNGGSTFNSSLMSQMKMVARLIELGSKPVLSGGLGMRRQIFFIQVGGYDTHTSQTNNAGATTTDNAKVILGGQANLFAELSQSLNALQLAMSDIGTLRSAPTSLLNAVTSFTVSDFSRTFPCNGSGSDHGWGGHHLVVGGAVKGGATYGKFPTLAVNGPDDTSTGRWIPTTAVDQYAASLATWFGVDANHLDTVFPNLGRFSSGNPGFI